MQELHSVSVPEEFVTSTGGEAVARQAITRLTVLDLRRRNVISTGKAAELLGMNRWDFAELLAEHNIPSFELLPDETLEEHLHRGQETFRRLHAE